jgi:hypothetical protein
MSIESVVNELDRLRETYTQRQKLAANTQAALKGAAGALTKAERTVRIYTEQTGSQQDRSFDQARTTLAGMRMKEDVIDLVMPDLRREIKASTVIAAALKDAVTALRAEPIDVVRLGRAVHLFQAQKNLDAPVATLVPELIDQLAEGERMLSTTFGVALRDAFAAIGKQLGGVPPRFEVGRFEIATNFGTRSATILYGREVVVKRTALSVDAILRAYQAAEKLIMGRNENPVEWLKQLHTAWDGIRLKYNAQDKRANIVECYLDMLLQRQPKAFRVAPLKSSFTDYMRAQFAYDFDTFTRQGLLHNGLRAFGTSATKSHTENPERSIFIVHGDAPYDGGYVGDVKFDRDE